MPPPDVSIIIPVFNSVEYVEEAIRSVLNQTISPERVELIVVDDGSTDGSDVVINRLAAQDARITVLTQENSGTPGGARNPALDLARGTFIFFLDSDALLSSNALQRMVDVAIAEDSDVVLGKISSTDRRRVPTSMFKRTILDAHLVNDRVFNTLGSTKLIRRDIIDRLHLRFPTDQTVGEDEPFMAAAYLNARKFSVLADMDYYIVQYRSDGANMTLAKQGSAAHAKTALRVASVIEQYTEPGDFRDALLKRAFDRPLARALDPRWLTLGPEDQSLLTDRITTGLKHLYTDGAREFLRATTRIKLDLLMAGNLRGLNSYISYLTERKSQKVEWSNGDFRLSLPEHLAELIPIDQRVTPAPEVTCRLEDLSVEGDLVKVAVSVRIPSLDGGPDSITLRSRLRDTESFVDFPATYDDTRPGPTPFYLTAECAGLPRGIWDLYVVVHFGAREIEQRLGAERSRAIEPEGASNVYEDPAPHNRVIAYFTQGRGNLSIDRGSILHKQFAVARAIGLTLDENGRAVLLVQTTRKPRSADDYFCYLEGVKQHGGRQLLPSTQLGERLLGLRLPLTDEMVGASVTVAAVLGDVKVPLPIVGTDYWPARAAGFGLAPNPTGGVTVVSSTFIGRPRKGSTFHNKWRHSPPQRTLAERFRTSTPADIVRRTPLLGPVARFIMKGLRGAGA